MQISPETSQWINVAFAVVAVVASGAIVFPDYVPAIVAHYIVQTNACLLALFAGVNVALHRYSSGQAGPGVAASVQPSATASLLGFLAVIGVGAMLFGPAPAEAASLDLSNLSTQLQKASLEDAQAALDDATKMEDLVASTCYAAFITLVQAQQSVSTATLPKVHLITTFQRLRDLRVSIRTGSKIRTACASLAAEVGADFQTFLGMLATGSISAAKLGLL